ncbi:hypothetical protein Tco_0184808 [Tanacetum coccineum]
MKRARTTYQDENKGTSFVQEDAWKILRSHTKWDLPSLVEPVDLVEGEEVPGVGYEELFDKDARPRPPGSGLEKGYDRFQQLLSQLEAHGAEVSTEDANHKFLRSLPPAWSNLAMTMRTNPEIDTLSIDDLYNNLRVFEQEIQGASKTSSSAQNVAFVSQSKSSTNKVKSGFTGAYSTCTPSTSSTNIPEKEVLAGFADEVIYSLFAKQSED